MAQDESVALSWSELLLFRALYPILCLSMIIRFFRDRSLHKQAANWPLTPYTLYLCSTLFSALYSGSPHTFDSNSAFSLLGQFVIALLFILSAAHVQTPGDFTRIAAASVIAALSLSGWVLWTTAHLNFDAFRGGIEVNQNYVSLFILAGAIPLLHALFRLNGLWKKAGILGLLSLVIFVSVLLASRGALTAFAAAALVMTPKLIPGKAAKSYLLVAIVLCGALVFSGGLSMLSSRSDTDVGSLNGRGHVWLYSLYTWAGAGFAHMIFGLGYNSAQVVLPPAMEPGSWNYHNEYLNILMDGGIIGLGVFLTLLLSVWRRINATDHSLHNVMRGWFVFLIVSGVSGVVSGVQIFWLLLGAIVGAVAAQKTPSEVRFSHPIRAFYQSCRAAIHASMPQLR